MAIQKIELSAALNSLATQNNMDKLTGVLNGAAGNISKEDLASVVAGMILSKRIYLSANETYTFQIIGGIVAIETDTVQNGGALITYSLYGVGVKVSNLLGDLYVEGDVSTSSKVACWRDASGCHIRNNWNSGFSFYYSTFSFKV